MFGRSKRRLVCYAVMGSHGTVHSAGNPDLREDWTLQDLANNWVVKPGDRCFVWDGDVFFPARVMGDTAARLEQQFGAPDAVAEL